MKCLNIDIKTNKKSITKIIQKTLDSIKQAKQYNETKQKVINDLKQSIKTKLVNLGFTEDECKYIIH